MSFHDVSFPDTIGVGSSGGPGFKTDIVEVDSGAEVRIPRRSLIKHMYDVTRGVVSQANYIELKKFYTARQGATYGFRFKDHTDYTSADDGQSAPANTDQLIGTGDGTNLTFQLVKNYTSGGIIYVHPITKPVAGTVVIADNGSNVVSAGNWSVNNSNGVVTFAGGHAPAAGHTITAGFQFDVPVRFDKIADEHLKMTWNSYQTLAADSITLIEILDPVQVDSMVPMGGAESVALTADYALSVSNAKVVTFVPDASGHVVKMPALSILPMGAMAFVLINTNASSYTITIKDSTGSTTLLTLAANTLTEVHVATPDNSTKVLVFA